PRKNSNHSPIDERPAVPLPPCLPLAPILPRLATGVFRCLRGRGVRQSPYPRAPRHPGREDDGGPPRTQAGRPCPRRMPMLPDGAQPPGDLPPTILPQTPPPTPLPADEPVPATKSPGADQTGATLARAGAAFVDLPTVQVPGYEVLSVLGRGGM